ncbi:MAG: endonuclease MutS2 [Flammeovirgaceae bacterium]
MLYPKNLEQKLSFDRIRELLKEKCNGKVAQDFVDKIRFTGKSHVLQKLISQTAEFLRILSNGEEFPSTNFIDLQESLQKSQIEGTFLTEEECYEMKLAFITLKECLEFIKNKEKSYPYLTELSQNIEFQPLLIKEIDLILDERGKIKDNASSELLRIRKRLVEEQHSIRKRLDNLLHSLKLQGLIKEEALPTVRDGRMVIPVPVEHKRHVRGFIHDTSASGQTVFLEPENLLDINNEIRELQLAERQEIIKILITLTNKIRPHVPSLQKANVFLGMIDFIRAKAKLAQEMNAIAPEFEDKPFLKWYAAYHPLLYLSGKTQGKNIVPQDIKLDEENRILVISGPNAGGKSVALKTVGLIQYMFQCGLLVPISEGSKMGIFQDLFLDIGDEQSIDNDLSTYSSHLTNMKHFLKNANEHSLFLIDEFGAGTEPELGGAIAEAILEHLNELKSYGIITTHYANLKFYADKTKGLLNGAMRYDVENLQPLYKLDIGVPGSSFALEIATNIGLPKKVVHTARQRVGQKKVNIEKLLKELELEKRELEENNRLLEKKDKELAELLVKYNKLKDEIEENKRQILKEAKLEASRILAEANQKIENTIRFIRENNADKELTKFARKELDDFKEEIKTDLSILQEIEEKEEIEKEEVEIEEGTEIKEGSWVKLKDTETIGEVISLKGKEAVVLIGEIKTTVKMNRLQKVSRKELRANMPKKTLTPSVSTNEAFREKLMDFSPELDIRGKRAEEVFPILDDFMDNAIMLNQTYLRILHGKGDGILRELVRTHLRKYKEVKSLQDEHADRGGAGYTVVMMR